MRVGALYAVLRLEKGAFDAALTSSGGKFAAFAGAIKAGAILTGQVMAGVAAASLYMASSFEQHMNQSLAIMGDVAPKLRQEMEDAARAVAKTTLFSATQAADAYYFLASAGFTAQQSIAALPAVAKFAQAGMMDLETATELLMDTQTTMGLRTQDATQNFKNMTRVSDVLTAAQVHSNATLQQMAEAMTNKAGPALRLLNKDIEEGAAVLAVMANQGVKGRVAGTNLAIVLRELQTKAIKNKDAFRDLGVAVYDAEGNMRNMADIIEDLEQATEGLSDEQKKQVLLDLGFTDRSVGFIQALLGRSQAIRDYEKMLREAGGTTEEVAEKQLDTLNAQLKIAWHRIQDVAISIGQHMLPGAKDIVKAFNDWIDVNDDLIVSIATGIIDAIAKAVGWIGRMVGVIGELAESMGRLFSGRSISQDFFGSWGWIQENFPGIADTIEDVAYWMGSLVRSLDEAPAALGELVDDFKELFGGNVINNGLEESDFFGTWGWLEEHLPAVAKAFEDIGYWTGAVVRNFGHLEEFAGDDTPLGKIGDAVVFLNDAIDTFINETLPDLEKALKPIVDAVLYGLGERIDWLTTDVIPPLVSIWNQIVNDTLPKVGETFDWLAKEVFPVIAEAIQWFIDNPMRFLQDAFTGLLTWVDENWPSIQRTIELALEAIGEAFALAALVIGIFVTTVWALIQPIIDTLFPDFEEAGSDLLTALQIVFTSIAIGIRTVRMAIEGQIMLIKAAINGLVWIINRVIDGLNAIITAANFLTGTNTPLIPYIGEAKATYTPSGFKTSLSTTPTGERVVSGSYGSPTTSTGGGGSGGVRLSAAGTMAFPGGWTWVGEQGPELMRLPTGSQVMSNALSRMFMERGQGVRQAAPRPIYVTVEGSMKNVEKPEDLLKTLQLVDYLEKMRKGDNE